MYLYFAYSVLQNICRLQVPSVPLLKVLLGEAEDLRRSGVSVEQLVLTVGDLNNISAALQCGGQGLHAADLQAVLHVVGENHGQFVEPETSTRVVREYLRQQHIKLHGHVVACIAYLTRLNPDAKCVTMEISSVVVSNNLEKINVFP